jgi:hypothetical protein
MKNSDLKTTDNFLRDDCYVFVETMPGNTETAYLKEDVKEMMVAYGEWLRQTVLREASEKAKTEIDWEWRDGEECLINGDVNKDSILNAFSKEWIS